MKRIIASLLILAMLLTIAVSCAAQTDGKSGETSVTTAADIASDIETERSQIKDNVPALNYENRDFRVIYHDSQFYTLDIVANETNGDIINDAVYERNLYVEERLGVNILPVPAGSNSTGVIDVVKPSVLSASDDFDFVVSHAIRTAALVGENLFCNWYDIPYIELEQPWWIQKAVEQLTVGDKAYLMLGDYALIAIGGTYCMYFNKDIGDANGIGSGNLYTTVTEGGWTYDYMNGIVKNLALDIDGDGKMGDGDQYGLFTTTNSPAVAYQWAFNAPLTSRDSDNMPELVLDQGKWSTVVDTVYSLYYDNAGTYVKESLESEFPMFRNESVFLINAYLQTSILFRDLDFDYGIIPYPKLDEDQSDYMTMVDGFHTLFCIPITVTDTDFVGATVELLNAESYRSVVPTYYETALKVKYARDNESVQIMDMILDGRAFDFGYFYDNWTGFAFMLQDLMQKKSKDFASYYASRESQAIAQFESVMEAYSALD